MSVKNLCDNGGGGAHQEERVARRKLVRFRTFTTTLQIMGKISKSARNYNLLSWAGV